MKVAIADREDIVRLVLEKKQRPTTVARIKKIQDNTYTNYFTNITKQDLLQISEGKGEKKIQLKPKILN